MADSQNLRNLKAAYADWDKTKGGIELWRELMADEFRLSSINEKTQGLTFAVDRVSKDDALDYLTRIFDEWTMLEYKPATYVEQGDRIAMFGACKYQHNKTGNIASCLIACLWEFNADGKAVAMTEVFDTAVAAAAATEGLAA